MAPAGDRHAAATCRRGQRRGEACRWRRHRRIAARRGGSTSIRRTSSVSRWTSSRPARSATRRPSRCSCRAPDGSSWLTASRSNRRPDDHGLVHQAPASSRSSRADRVSWQMCPSSSRNTIGLGTIDHRSISSDSYNGFVHELGWMDHERAAGHGRPARRRTARDVLRQGPIRRLHHRQPGLRRPGRSAPPPTRWSADRPKTCSTPNWRRRTPHQDAELWSSRQTAAQPAGTDHPPRRHTRLVRHHQGPVAEMDGSAVPGQRVGRPARFGRRYDRARRRSRRRRLRPRRAAPNRCESAMSPPRHRCRWCTSSARPGGSSACPSVSCSCGSASSMPSCLLATTELSLSDVADRCGYYDQSALTRQFRRVVGVSPGACTAPRSCGDSVA